jgi:hypothetical protein
MHMEDGRWWLRDDGAGESPAMDFDAFARGLRGSQDWRKEHARVSRLVSRRPLDAITLAAALDSELERSGFDLAVQAIRRSLLDLVAGVGRGDATQIASQPGIAHPGTPAPQLRRSRGAMQIAGTRPAAEIWQLLADTNGLRQTDPEFGLLLLHELAVRG